MARTPFVEPTSGTSAGTQPQEVRALTSDVIRAIIQEALNPACQNLAEAQAAFQDICRASFAPCLYGITSFLGKSVPQKVNNYLNYMITTAWIRQTSIQFNPPFSRQHLTERAIEDWLIVCVAADGY